MGLKKRIEKQKKKIGHKLEKVAARANAILEEVTSTSSQSAPSTTNHDTGGAPSMISSTPQKMDTHSSIFFKLGNVATNLQKGLKDFEKYDYQVENTKDEATGQTTTKIVTRDKTTGNIVSSHTQIRAPDGTIRVTTFGKAPFAGFSSEQERMPSEIPTDGSQVEFTIREGKGDEETIFACEVKDGPEAGKKMQYKITKNSDGKSEYELIQLHNPHSFKSQSMKYMGFLFFCTCTILIMASLGKNHVLVLFQMNTLVMNSICMPIAPYYRLSAVPDLNARFEAPWWVPGSNKKVVFDVVCSGSQTVLEWKSQQSKAQLFVYVLKDTGKSTRKEKQNGITSAIFKPSEIGITYTNGRTTILEEVHWNS